MAEPATLSRAKTHFPTRLAALLGLVSLLVLVFSMVDLRPSLQHLDIHLLSGPPSGAYHQLAADIAKAAKRQRAHCTVLDSEGSVDNLTRLAAARNSCEIEFAFAQDGIPLPDGIEILARLPRSESVFFLGREAAKLTHFSQLEAKNIGVGPANGGSDYLARQLFALPDLARLGVKLHNGSHSDQLARLASGELELGLFVIDEDASVIREATTQGKLQLASFQHLDVIARRFDFLWHGRIGAGQFDAVLLVPPKDKRVLRVDTLVVGNGCAPHAQTVGFLSLLHERFPTLVEHQRRRGHTSGAPLNRSARDFFEAGGLDIADKHVPWLVNIMPPSSWAYVVMALSLLFNAMAFGHRFRLWRIDADRVKVDLAVRDALGMRFTVEEIHELEPTEQHRDEKTRGAIARALDDLGSLRLRCRRHSASMLVPMGQEMAYRYQEDQIEEALSALRCFAGRYDPAAARTENEQPESNDDDRDSTG